jgi:AcrR family transcriptional regulator
MPRKKKYNKREVAEKAMNVFWKYGYKNTSMQFLEREMGINKFSIYDSFGDKENLLHESLKLYMQNLREILNKLDKSDKHIEAIKEYFYDFAKFSQENNKNKGCLIVNVANEMFNTCNPQIKNTLINYLQEVKNAFARKLSESNKFTEEEIKQHADYLIIAMTGFASATKIFNKKQLDNYVNMIFKNLM